jgi:hypothetical protein
MRGKSLFLVLGLVAVLLALALFSTLGIKKLSAAPTSAAVVLTNIALLNWNGGSAGDTNVSAGVGTNFGASWIGTNNLTTVAGNYISNVTYLTNEGNLQATFILTSYSNYTGVKNTASKPWTNWFTNLTTPGARAQALTVTLSPGGFANINFEVFAPINETNSALMTFNLFASNSNATFAPGTGNASNYTGLNGIVYGGTMGMYGMPFTTIMTNGQPVTTNWVVTVAAANMTIAKTVNVSNTFPFQLETAVPYPGALISYKVAYNNIGSSSAATVRIVDSMPTNYVTLNTTAALLRKLPFAGTFANYFAAAGVAKTFALSDDDASTNDLAGDQIVFCPELGTAPLTGGTVNAAQNGAYFFSVYLK